MPREAMRVDQPARCHQCDHPLESPVGCLNCHTVFPSASPLSHFDRLGLPARYELSLDELEKKYLAWSRELHPDFFQTRGAEEQSLSLKLAASLNDAYATLKDPFRRAEYLLLAYGGPSASVHREMPEGFLEDVLELRMEIEEVKEEGDAAGDAARALRDQIKARRAQTMSAIAEQFRAIESKPQPPARGELERVRELLNTVKYFDGLLRELAAT